MLLVTLPLLKQFVTISFFLKNARAYCIFWGGSCEGGGGREGGRGGEGDLIEPPKYKQLTSKSGLEVFPPAPIWVCIHRWTLLKPRNLAISYKTLRKQCIKTEDFWNRSSCIFKRLILLIFILFFSNLSFILPWLLWFNTSATRPYPQDRTRRFRRVRELAGRKSCYCIFRLSSRTRLQLCEA